MRKGRYQSIKVSEYQRKSLWFFYTALAIYAFVIIGCAKREIKNVDSKGKNIICFGDSITFGYGANPGEDYPTELSKLLNIPVINAGVDADTTFIALRRLEPDVLSKQPYLVIVEFCGNDFIKKISKEDTIRNLREIIRKIQKQGAMVALVDISAGFFLREYRIAFKKLAQEEGAIFVPAILSGILTNPSMKSDFLHPNATGYKIVAERIYRAIKPYLKDSRG
jgi:lysophospholipase L1-like esterase